MGERLANLSRPAGSSVIGLLVGLLLLGGCAGRQPYPVVQERLQHLREGMTPDQVRELLGAPWHRETLDRERHRLLHWTYGGIMSDGRFLPPIELYFDRYRRLQTWTPPPR